MIKIYVAGVSCSACHMLKRRLENYFKSNPTHNEYVEYVSIFDADDDIERYGISSAPTAIAFNENGEIVWRVDGYNHETNYEEKIAEYVKNLS